MYDQFFNFQFQLHCKDILFLLGWIQSNMSTISQEVNIDANNIRVPSQID